MYHDLACKFDAIRLLPDGWDSYGAKAVPGEIVDAAYRFCWSLPAPSLLAGVRVVPTASSTIQLEWVKGKKLLELEFENADTVHFLQSDSANGVDNEGSFPATDVAFGADLVRWFFGAE